MIDREKNLWWGPPQNFDERKNERKISWLELFYDLVYVAAIGQLTYRISTHPDWPTLGYSLLIFCLVFWSWVNGSQYYDLHGDGGIRTRLLTFWQMLAVAAAAITIPSAFDGHQQSFAIAFSMIQVMITYLWWSVGLYDPSHRVFNKFYTVNYSLSFVLLIVSVFTSYTVATCLWVIILFLNLTPAVIGNKVIVTEMKKRGQVFTASASIVERFGLFTIIVLAESILGTVTGFSGVTDKHPAEWVAFILAILIAFLLWCLYFDMTSEQETKVGFNYLKWLVFLHFPLLASLIVVGACLKVFLLDMATGLPSHLQWMFCTAIATFLFMIVALTKIMKEEEEYRVYIRLVSRLLIIAAIALLLLPLIGQMLNAVAFMATVAVILFVPVFAGIRTWVRYKFFGKQDCTVNQKKDINQLINS